MFNMSVDISYRVAGIRQIGMNDLRSLIYLRSGSIAEKFDLSFEVFKIFKNENLKS